MRPVHGVQVQSEGVSGRACPSSHGRHLRQTSPLERYSFVYPAEVRHVRLHPVRDHSLLHASIAPQLLHWRLRSRLHGTISCAPLQSAQVPHNASEDCVPAIRYSTPSVHATVECSLHVCSSYANNPSGHCSWHEYASLKVPRLLKTLPDRVFAHA
jgi:hypothetical protein